MLLTQTYVFRRKMNNVNNGSQENNASFVSTADRIKAALLANASESGSQRGLLLPWLLNTQEDQNLTLTQMSTPAKRPNDSLRSISNTTKPVTEKINNNDITEMYKNLKGIESLYDWQEDCLNCESLVKRRNLIIAMPTSAGKTLVAEILMMREILLQNKPVMLVLPYVSLVQEKVRGLAPLSLRFDFSVEEYAGGKGAFPPIRRRRQSLYVATIEKASSLTSAFIDPTLHGSAKRFIKDIGLVIVDEVHMLGDGQRGAVLEGALIKLRTGFPNVQIVTMSATVGNINELAESFDADIYHRQFRPVPLFEYIMCNKTLYEFNEKAGQFEPAAGEGKETVPLPGKLSYPGLQKLDMATRGQIKRADTDDLFGLIGDLVYDKKQCLVFCSTRRASESAAVLIAKIISAISSTGHSDDKSSRLKRIDLLKQMTMENEGQCCPILRKTIPVGVAYHHAGLMPEERVLVEQGYSDGLITVLCCTSTLAAGVNLPARRVVIRSPFVGPNFLSVDRYRQMAGRAGRAKLDTLGQCVVMCDTKDFVRVSTMMRAPLNSCISCLPVILPTLTLEMTCIGVIDSIETLIQVITKYSLWARQRNDTEKTLSEELSKITNDLIQTGLLCDFSEVHNVEQKFKATSLGRATIAASFTPQEARSLHSELKKAQSMITLASPIHMLYIITPNENLSGLIDAVDFSILAREINNLQLEADIAALSLLNLSESHIARMRGSGSSTIPLFSASPVVLASILPYARLQLTLALRCIWYGANYWDAATRLGLNRGAVFQLMNTATAYAHAAHRFAAQISDLWPMADLMLSLNKRLVEAPLGDLNELLDVPGVRIGRARQLAKAGYTTLSVLATVDPDKLSKEISHLSRKAAVSIIEAAQVAVRERVRILQDQAENVIEDTLSAALDPNQSSLQLT